jgi:hypothetical protein
MTVKLTIQEIQEDLHYITSSFLEEDQNGQYLETWFEVAEDVHADLVARGEHDNAALVRTVIDTRRFLEQRFG